MKFFTILISLGILLNSSIRFQKMDRMYFNDNFHLADVYHIQKVHFSFNDTIPNDTLHFCFSKNNLPLAVFRDILTGVCLDGECRIVKIRLYWTVTGRYLGYFLKKGQELTKREHLVFSEGEYQQLHKVLNDSISVLQYYSLSEIQPKKPEKVKTDGITGATAPDLSGYIVPEAAYTSHTLWHLVYGDTRDSIISWSSKHLSEPLMDSLFASTNVYDRKWALENIGEFSNICQKFAGRILDNLSRENSELVQKSISVLESCSGSDSLFQYRMIPLLSSLNADIRNFTVNYFQTHRIQPKVASKMIDQLLTGEYGKVNTILAAMKNYDFSATEIQTISTLLQNKNNEIAWRAYSFLIVLPNKSSALEKKLNKFINYYQSK